MPFLVPALARAFQHQHATLGDIELELRPAVVSDAEIWLRDWRPRLARGGEPSAGWQWREHITRAAGELDRLCLVVARQERLEAMLSLSLLERALDGDAPNRRLVYVEYIQVAPDNQPPPMGSSAIRGLGALMMLETARLSVQLGRDGRVGLHAKPEAEGFYRRLEMTAVGDEDTEDGRLLYFEWTPAAAQRFLDKLHGHS